MKYISKNRFYAGKKIFVPKKNFLSNLKMLVEFINQFLKRIYITFFIYFNKTSCKIILASKNNFWRCSMLKKIFAENIWCNLKKSKSLVYNITNYVTANDCAIFY